MYLLEDDGGLCIYWRMMEGYVSPLAHVIRKVAKTNHQNYYRRIPFRSTIKRMTEISVWINQSMYIESILVFIVTSNLWVMDRCRETSCGNNRQMTIIIEYANIYYARITQNSINWAEFDFIS